MLNIKNFITGQVKFEVNGLPQTCLNKLRSFRITNISINNDIISFCVSLVYADAIKKLISNFDYRMYQNYNLFRGVNYLLNHFVLVVAIMVAVSIYFVVDMKIYRIRVQCDDSNLTSAVYERLDQLGVKRYTFKNQLSNNLLALNLVENFDSIAHATVRIAGNTLVVNIVTATNQTTQHKNNFYAQFDAVIKDITVYSGKPMVGVGDVVKKGDLLVADAYSNTVIVMGEVAFVNDNQISRFVIPIT